MRRFLPGVPRREIEEIFSSAAGNEISSGKFDSPESSAALAANSFGFFLNRPSHLPPLPGCENESWPAQKERKAAAYYVCKWAICRIPQYSIIYLYHTGIGVIAKGKATDSFRKKAFGDDIDEEFYIPLDFEWAVPKEDWDGKAIPPRQINSRLNSGHRFRQTAFAISDDMANTIDNIAKEKQTKG